MNSLFFVLPFRFFLKKRIWNKTISHENRRTASCKSSSLAERSRTVGKTQPELLNHWWICSGFISSTEESVLFPEIKKADLLNPPVTTVVVTVLWQQFCFQEWWFWLEKLRVFWEDTSHPWAEQAEREVLGLQESREASRLPPAPWLGWMWPRSLPTYACRDTSTPRALSTLPATLSSRTRMCSSSLTPNQVKGVVNLC